MRKLRFPFLAATLCVAATAFAQSTAPAATPTQVGPFPPQPGDDPSLYRTLPAEAYLPPPAERQPSSTGYPQTGVTPESSSASSGANAAARPAVRPASPPVVVVVPEAVPAIPRQLERAQIEAEAARTPAPINGEFTGETDERFR